jgi:hypothetical protein
MSEKSISVDSQSSAEQNTDASVTAIDLQELAQQLYEKLRRELEIENERLGLS